MTVVVGKKIPSWTAESTEGKLSSHQLIGKRVVLYFYPRDNTPGCTTEAQDFRDLTSAFDALNTIIIGVSRDTLSSHTRFIHKHTLSFALISDPDETLCELFGVMSLKNMYGKQVRGIQRSTFLIDEKGILQQEWRGLNVSGHAQHVLEAIQAL